MGFAVSLFQNKALIGSNGILPVPAYMERLRNHFKLKWVKVFNVLNISTSSESQLFSECTNHFLNSIKMTTFIIFLLLIGSIIVNWLFPRTGETNTKSVLAVPTLFWFVTEEHTDTALNLISTSGWSIS